MKQRQDAGNLLQPAAFCPDIKPWPMDSLDGISWDTIFCGPMTICDVPESQVPLYSGIMAELLSRILENSRNAWKALLLLPRMVFVLPRGGKKFDHQVYLNLMMFKAGEWETLLSRKFRKMGESSPFPPSKEKRATALARAGYFSGAARVLTSGELCDTSNPEVYAKLKELHPEPDAPPAPLLKAAACPFTSKHLFDAISSLRPRRAPDAAGWRAEYFRRLTKPAKDQLFLLAQRVAVQENVVPDDLRPFLFGARLIASKKKDNGVRPIAIGSIFRKVISAAIALAIKPDLEGHFTPCQFGAGIAGGAESVVQGLRIFQALSDQYAVVGIDFSNAFNSVDRDAIAKKVSQHFPLLKTWFTLCYGKPSQLLVHGQPPISSARGVQQGDPLGPFFFSLALQPILQAVSSRECCVMAYLDDVHLCGLPEAVAAAANAIRTESKKIGLQCNINKCWSTTDLSAHGFACRVDSKPTVLGVPLDIKTRLPPEEVPSALVSQIVALPDTQSALHLLRYVHNSRFTYQFRLSCKTASRDLAAAMMCTTRKALCDLLRCQDIPDHSWQQALLPRGPGLGLSNLPLLAPLMSAASLVEACVRLSILDRDHFEDIIRTQSWRSSNSGFLKSLLNTAIQECGDYTPSDPKRAKLQHYFAVEKVNSKQVEAFLGSGAPVTAKAIVQSVKESPIASQFLQAVPSQKCLALSGPEMRIALCLLLGVPFDFVSDRCDCGVRQLESGSHAISCKRRGGLIVRHNLVKHVIADLCKCAQLHTQVEPPQAFTGSHKRPDIVVRMAENGRDVAFDITVVNPTRNLDNTRSSAVNGLQTLQAAERAKINKYRDLCISTGMDFVPIVFSAHGGVTPDTFHFGLDYLINKVKKASFVSPNWAAPNKKTYWLQRIAIALWSGVSAQLKPLLVHGPLTTP